jgi:hypothetical protein
MPGSLASLSDLIAILKLNRQRCADYLVRFLFARDVLLIAAFIWSAIASWRILERRAMRGGGTPKIASPTRAMS